MVKNIPPISPVPAMRSGVKRRVAEWCVLPLVSLTARSRWMSYKNNLFETKYFRHAAQITTPNPRGGRAKKITSRKTRSSRCQGSPWPTHHTLTHAAHSKAKKGNNAGKTNQVSLDGATTSVTCARLQQRAFDTVTLCAPNRLGIRLRFEGSKHLPGTPMLVG